MRVPRIIRSRRRSIALIVTREAELVVRAPWHLAQRHITEFVLQKQGWVERKVLEAEERLKTSAPKKFVPGEMFLVLGQEYPLRITDQASEIALEGAQLIFPGAFLSSPREHLKAWYVEQARKVIVPRVEFFARREGFVYRDVRMSHAERRWGSCGSGGRLNFSWRLVMLPEDVIDYLVVHELCHLRHRNHARPYWDAVREIMPSFEIQERRLRSYESAVIL